MRFRISTVDAPDLDDAPFDQRWRGADGGLILTWTIGLQMAGREPELAAAALRGELPVLPWKGGVARAIKGPKLGALHYLATWQGLRGEDLDIDTENPPTLRCARTGVEVSFTGDLQQLLKVDEEADR